MMIVQTPRTYRTYDNAVTALRRACEKTGFSIDDLRWMVAAVPESNVINTMRYAPVVVFERNRPEMLFLAHHYVTVVG